MPTWKPKPLKDYQKQFRELLMELSKIFQGKYVQQGEFSFKAVDSDDPDIMLGVSMYTRPFFDTPTVGMTLMYLENDKHAKETRINDMVKELSALTKKHGGKTEPWKDQTGREILPVERYYKDVNGKQVDALKKSFTIQL